MQQYKFGKIGREEGRIGGREGKVRGKDGNKRHGLMDIYRWIDGWQKGGREKSRNERRKKGKKVK